MGDVAIRVEGLGKQYRLGGPRERYSTLRDQIQKWTSLRGLLRRAVRAEHRPPFWALKDVSFEVGRGEVVGIIGRNGAGKSTLLKILSRITEPTEGAADIHGRVGSLLEVGTGFHPELSGRENVYLNGAILGMRRAEIARKFDEIVAFAEVEKFIDTPVKHYSSGMYMRLAFAVAAHLEPEVLVVDEVLAVGDAEFQKKCLGKMGDVARDGRTVLFVSHNMNAVQNLCTFAVHLRGGTVVEQGPTAGVVGRYLEEAMDWVHQGPGAMRLREGLYLTELMFDPCVLPSGGRAAVSVGLRAEADVKIDGLCVLIHSRFDVRVAVLDLRVPTGPYRLRAGQTARIEAEVRRIPLVEGEYKIGLFIETGARGVDFPDLGLIKVGPAESRSPVLPYPAPYRGFVELDHAIPRLTVTRQEPVCL
jgi:lipopolysaccharide transport system ATP-binding protein